MTIGMKAMITAAVAACTLSACATQEQTNAAIGAGVGAAAGGLLGRGVSDNRGRGTVIGAVLGGAAGGAVGYNLNTIEQKLGIATHGSGATVKETPDGALKVEIPGSVSFDSGSASLKSEFRPALERVAQSLAGESASVDRSRITTRGSGELEPLADNATEAGRAQNRRVELVVRPHKS